MATLTNRYRELLETDPSLDSVELVLGLVEDSVGRSMRNVEIEQRIAALAGEDERDDRIRRALPEHIAEFELPKFESDRLRRWRNREKLEFQYLVARVANALLHAPAIAEQPDVSSSRYSLILDSCLLLFHHSYFAILPVLRGQWQRERDFLLRSAGVFSKYLNAPRDFFRVRGLLELAAGNISDGVAALRASVESIGSHEEDYITSVQALWTELIELREYRSALVFLVDCLPRTTWLDLDELRGMMLATVDLTTASNP